MATKTIVLLDHFLTRSRKYEICEISKSKVFACSQNLDGQSLSHPSAIDFACGLDQPGIRIELRNKITITYLYNIIFLVWLPFDAVRTERNVVGPHPLIR